MTYFGIFNLKNTPKHNSIKKTLNLFIFSKIYLKFSLKKDRESNGLKGLAWFLITCGNVIKLNL